MNSYSDGNVFDPVPLSDRLKHLEKKIDTLNMTLCRIEKLLQKTDPVLTLVSKLPTLK